MTIQSTIDAYLKAKADIDNDEIEFATADLEYTAAYWKLINAKCETAEDAATKIKFINENLEPELMPAQTLSKLLRSVDISATPD